MARPSPASVEPVVVGVSHKTAPSSLRDRLFAEEAQLPPLLAALKQGGLDQGLGSDFRCPQDAEAQRTCHRTTATGFCSRGKAQTPSEGFARRVEALVSLDEHLLIQGRVLVFCERSQ